MTASGLGLWVLISCTSVSPGYQRDIRQLPAPVPAQQPPGDDAPPPKPLKTGTLVLRVSPLPEDFQVQLDDRSASLGSTTLPLGTHRLSWRSFGYREGERLVEIRENATTFVDLRLEPAVFALTQFSVSRGGRINPGLYGAAGRVTLAFHANAPGTARIDIFSADGQPVFASTLDVDAWNTALRWHASDAVVPLPDGEYVARLGGAGASGIPVAESTVRIVLDRTLPAYHPRAGTVPAADASDPGVLQGRLGFTAHGGPVDGLTVWDNRMELFASVGLLPGWELVAEADGRLVTWRDFVSGEVRAGLSWNPWRSNTSSTSVRFWAGNTRSSLGLVGAVYADTLTLSGLLGLSVAAAGVTAEGRAGLRWAPVPFVLELSGAVGGDLPVVVSRLAFDLGPEVPLELGLVLEGRAYAWDDWVFYGGAGLSFALDTLDLASW